VAQDMLSKVLVNTKWAFRFHKWQEISWPVEYFFSWGTFSMKLLRTWNKTSIAKRVSSAAIFKYSSNNNYTIKTRLCYLGRYWFVILLTSQICACSSFQLQTSGKTDIKTSPHARLLAYMQPNKQSMILIGYQATSYTYIKFSPATWTRS